MKRAGAALALVALVAAGCSTSGHGGSQPPASSPTPSTSLTPTSAPVSTTDTSSAPPTTAPATSAPPDSAATSPTAPTAHTTCTSVDVRVIIGSAGLGEEFAALQFVNTGAKACVLAGYPTATLYRNGAEIGQSSQPSSITPSVRTLRPGDVAESKLHDYSTCQAPLSDSVRVQLPGLSTTVTRPGQLRGCILRVDRLGAPD